jgi:hypothetical protein
MARICDAGKDAIRSFDKEINFTAGLVKLSRVRNTSDRRLLQWGDGEVDFIYPDGKIVPFQFPRFSLAEYFKDQLQDGELNVALPRGVTKEYLFRLIGHIGVNSYFTEEHFQLITVPKGLGMGATHLINLIARSTSPYWRGCLAIRLNIIEV